MQVFFSLVDFSNVFFIFIFHSFVHSFIEKGLLFVRLVDWINITHWRESIVCDSIEMFVLRSIEVAFQPIETFLSINLKPTGHTYSLTRIQRISNVPTTTQRWRLHSYALWFIWPVHCCVTGTHTTPDTIHMPVWFTVFVRRRTATAVVRLFSYRY